jgi:Tfp pilus assembly PilM family ATPase
MTISKETIKTIQKNNLKDVDVLDNYKVTLTNDRVWYVPIDEMNIDYQVIKKWITDGNTIEEAD